MYQKSNNKILNHLHDWVIWNPTFLETSYQMLEFQRVHKTTTYLDKFICLSCQSKLMKIVQVKFHVNIV